MPDPVPENPRTPRALRSRPRLQYAPALESTSVVTIRPRYGLFIGGSFVDARDGRTTVTVNPADEQPLAEVGLGGAADVDAAVRAARRALPRWSGLAGKERAKVLFRIARVLQERARELAVLETLDNGKPI